MNENPKPPARKQGSLIQSLISLITPSSASEKRSWSEGELTQWLVQRIAEATDTHPSQVDLETPFADFGLDSRTAVSMSADLEKMLGRELPPTLIWDYPTIAEVTKFLCSEEKHEELGEMP